MSPQIPPHAGTLVNGWADPALADQRKASSRGYPSRVLSTTELGLVLSMLDGSLSPVCRFHGAAEHAAISAERRLPDGTFWPVPMCLPIDPATAAAVEACGHLALRDVEGLLVAILDVDEVWLFDGNPHVAGNIVGIESPGHHDFPESWAGPRAVRSHSERAGWQRILAYVTSRVINRAEHAMITAGARRLQANVLIQLATDIPEPGDVMHYARVRSVQHAASVFLAQTAQMHLRARVAATPPDQLLLDLIIAQNYGCSHLLDPGGDKSPEVPADLHIELVRSTVPRWSPTRGAFVAPSAGNDGAPEAPSVAAPDEARLLRAIEVGEPLPAWSTWPEVVAELRRARPPRSEQGFTLLFTGLSGSGKSTIAKTVMSRLMAIGSRRATLLDGDLVRAHLSSELGFTREDRNLNVLRIGFVAAEITKNGGIAICAPIAPYADIRRRMREMVEAVGGFIEVYVCTPLEVCEARDRKGLYAKARAGQIAEFTGISDPYEVPEHPDLRIDTSTCSPDSAAQEVILKLQSLGYIGADAGHGQDDYQYIM